MYHMYLPARSVLPDNVSERLHLTVSADWSGGRELRSLVGVYS